MVSREPGDIEAQASGLPRRIPRMRLRQVKIEGQPGGHSIEIGPLHPIALAGTGRLGRPIVPN